MFENFEYKKAAKGGGKLITGIVKAVSPESGAGVDEAGGGLGEVLKAAGVDLTEEEAAKQPPKADPKASPPQKTTARRFDEFGIAPPRPKRDAKGGWQEVTEYKTPDGQTVRLETPLESEPSDRDITAELLKQRGWKPEEVSKILAGPSVEAARVDEAEAARVDDGPASRTDEKTGVNNAAAPARRVPMAKAKRVTK